MNPTMPGISHHLTDDLLMAYAADTLPEAFTLVVATHISLCDDCRARLGAFEAVGGELLGQGEVAPMSEASLDTALARIAGLAPEARPPRPEPLAKDAFPAPLSDYARDASHVRWRPLGMGVKQAILPTSKAATVRLLHIPGGVAMPDHGHRGMELTLVLSGAFRDEEERFGPGDIEIADEAVEHMPVAEPGAPCICLAATDAKLRFTALIPRLVQPFFRI